MTVSRDDIANRAYEMYMERSYADGWDREDWRGAESELKALAYHSYTSAPRWRSRPEAPIIDDGASVRT
jgi:DUF2934 family protein